MVRALFFQSFGLFPTDERVFVVSKEEVDDGIEGINGVGRGADGVVQIGAVFNAGLGRSGFVFEKLVVERAVGLQFGRGVGAHAQIGERGEGVGVGQIRGEYARGSGDGFFAPRMGEREFRLETGLGKRDGSCAARNGFDVVAQGAEQLAFHDHALMNAASALALRLELGLDGRFLGFELGAQARISGRGAELGRAGIEPNFGVGDAL